MSVAVAAIVAGAGSALPIIAAKIIHRTPLRKPRVLVDDQRGLQKGKSNAEPNAQGTERTATLDAWIKSRNADAAVSEEAVDRAAEEQKRRVDWEMEEHEEIRYEEPEHRREMAHYKTRRLRNPAPRRKMAQVGGPINDRTLIVVVVVIVALLLIGLAALLSSWNKVWPRSAPNVGTPSTLALHAMAIAVLMLIFLVARRRIAAEYLRFDSPTRILSVFAFPLFLVGLSAAITYRHDISLEPDKIYKGLGAFGAMVAGMFVQVIGKNYTKDKGLLAISGSELVFPVLYSPFTYYPLVGISHETGNLIFLLYASFINGYFWESIVSSVKAQLGKEST